MRGGFFAICEAEKKHCTEEILRCGGSGEHAPCGGDFSLRAEPSARTVRRRFYVISIAVNRLRTKRGISFPRNVQSSLLGAFSHPRTASLLISARNVQSAPYDTLCRHCSIVFIGFAQCFQPASCDALGPRCLIYSVIFVRDSQTDLSVVFLDFRSVCSLICVGRRRFARCGAVFLCERVG